MTEEERDEWLCDADDALARALTEMSTAMTYAIEAEADSLVDDIHRTMMMIEAMLGFVPPPKQTHPTTEVMQ